MKDKRDLAREYMNLIMLPEKQIKLLFHLQICFMGSNRAIHMALLL